MKKLISWAFKEWRSSPTIAFFMVLHLALGFSAVLSVEGVRSGIYKALGNQSRPMLGADIALSSRRPIEEKEMNLVRTMFDQGIEKELSIIELYSMIDSKQGSKLTQIAAIEQEYPFYGQIILQKNQEIPAAKLLSSGKALISIEISEQLNLLIGDQIKIGEIGFQIEDIILEESANAIRGFSLAPKVMILKSDLLKTGLVSKGTTAFYQKLIKINSQVISDPILEQKYAELVLKIEDPAVKIVSHQKASEQLAQGLGYFQDYLGLVGLIAFCLALVATYFLFQTFLIRRRKTVAIYEVLGLSPTRQYFILMLLFSFYVLTALSITLLFLPILSLWIENQMSYWLKIPIILGFNTWLTERTIGSFLLLSSCALLSVLPLLIQERRQSLLTLLQPIPNDSDFNLSARKNRWHPFLVNLYSSIPLFIVFILTSIWITSSIRTGGLFALTFTVSAFLLFVVGRIFLRILEPLQFSNRLIEWSKRSLTRQKANTMVAFLSLALGVLLTTLVPDISLRMQSEFSPQTQSKLPGFFIFDILEEQYIEIKDFLKTFNITPLAEAPWIRGRLLKINDKNFDSKENLNTRRWQSREDEQQARMKNRGFNLSYRSGITEDEVMLEGRDFSGRYTGTDPLQEPVEVSIEQRFANQMEIKMNDLLTFDIQGMLIKGIVVNLRKVRWTSFKPNFFVVLQPGVLDDAPKTFLFALPNFGANPGANLGASQTANPIERKTVFQNTLAKKFPNISIVDVNQVTSKISKLLTQISLVIVGYGWLVLMIGILVVFSVQYLQAELKVNEILLMRLSGLDGAKVIIQNLFESFLLILFAIITGTILSSFIVEGVARFALQLSNRPLQIKDIINSLNFGVPIALQFIKIGIPSLLLVAWVYFRKTKIPLQNIIRE